MAKMTLFVTLHVRNPLQYCFRPRVQIAAAISEEFLSPALQF